jgi:putative transposase
MRVGPFVQQRLAARFRRFAVKWASSKPPFLIGRINFGGMGVPGLRRLRQLEEENVQVKKLVADLSLDRKMLQDIVKKALTASIKKDLVKYMIIASGIKMASLQYVADASFSPILQASRAGSNAVSYAHA